MAWIGNVGFVDTLRTIIFCRETRQRVGIGCHLRRYALVLVTAIQHIYPINSDGVSGSQTLFPSCPHTYNLQIDTSQVRATCMSQSERINVDFTLVLYGVVVANAIYQLTFAIAFQNAMLLLAFASFSGTGSSTALISGMSRIPCRTMRSCL